GAGTAGVWTPAGGRARRVGAALGRWNVAVDDWGGAALADPSAGAFARLAAELALDGVAPVPLLAALKHRLLRLGAPAGAHAAATDAVERAILRGPRPRAGCAGLTHALATFRDELARLRAGARSEVHAGEARALLADVEVAAAIALAARIGAALAPLERLASSERQPLAAFAAAHRDVVAALSLDESGTSAAFAGADGGALARFFDD